MSVLTHAVSDPLALIREASPVGLELRRFKCLPGCGRCCSYKVSLLRGDITRLESAGASRADFTDRCRQPASGFEACLTKRNGYCVFLDESRQCVQYAHRPLYCKLYPYIRETCVDTQLDVDLSCPGVGQGEALSDEQLAAVLAQDGSAEEHERLAERHRAAVQKAEQLLAFRARLEPYEEIVESVQTAAEDGFERLREFLKERASASAMKAMPRCDAPFHARATLAPSGQELLCGYMTLWPVRQTLWRWADAFLAVTPGVRSRSEAICSFLLEAAEVVAARASQQTCGKAADHSAVLAAIRENDGFLRTCCQAFRLEG